MAEIASSKEAIKLVTGAIRGDEVDEFLILQTGVQVPVKPDAATRLKFLQYATDHGFGKANQTVEYSGDASQLMIIRATPDPEDHD